MTIVGIDDPRHPLAEQLRSTRGHLPCPVCDHILMGAKHRSSGDRMEICLFCDHTQPAGRAP